MKKKRKDEKEKEQVITKVLLAPKKCFLKQDTTILPSLPKP